MTIFIVILNFNGSQYTLECLSSIRKLTTSSATVETVVVDNASTDDSVMEIRKNYPEVTLLVNAQNLGFSQGNNVGIAYALKRAADFVFIVNNDTSLDQNCLTELLTFADANPKAGVMGPKIYFSPGREFHRDRYRTEEQGKVLWYAGGKIDWDTMYATHRGVDEVDTGQYDQAIRTHFISGCALFARRNVFESIGVFDPKLYLYFEDVDFCKRAESKKFELYYVPQAVLWHVNAGSSGGAGSDLQSYYLTRNRLLIGMRYAPWKTKLALLREASRMLLKGTETERAAVGDFLRKKYGRRT